MHASLAANTAVGPSRLPADLLLDIIARSDTLTFIRCAAANKIIRGRILDPSFIARVTQQDGIIPPCILAYLRTHDHHEATPAAVSFTHNLLSPFISRNADDLLKVSIDIPWRPCSPTSPSC
ncbi:hypothetical protein ZWY2020_000101 [Hordeum vulgare]|nr:hypothetical protein ZWY2020_000101 [Hordeum vulgare]